MCLFNYVLSTLSTRSISTPTYASHRTAERGNEKRTMFSFLPQKSKAKIKKQNSGQKQEEEKEKNKHQRSVAAAVEVAGMCDRKNRRE